MDRSVWIISAIAIAVALVLAFQWERSSRRRTALGDDTSGRAAFDDTAFDEARFGEGSVVPLDDSARYEFLSPPWIEMARAEITDALSSAGDLDVEPYTLSEEFTDPPPHLRPDGGTIGFFVRVGRGRVEVGDRPEPGADCRVVSDYADALVVARDPDAGAADPEEAERRMATGKLRIIGDPWQMPMVLRQLDIHRLLARRTA